MGERWLETRTGKKVYPARPDIEVVNLWDISASLAKQCRYNGHTNHFYSVAEHSFILSAWINAEYQKRELTLQALLHDAAEAYLGDLIRPLKYGIFANSGYHNLEQEWTSVIMRKFGLPVDVHPCIKEADLGMLALERRHLFKMSDEKWDYEELGITVPNIDIPLMLWDPMTAESAFHDAVIRWASEKEGDQYVVATNLKR